MKTVVHELGNEGNKVIVIDDAVPAVAGLIEMAAASAFSEVVDNSYPGTRRPLRPQIDAERDYVTYLCNIAGRALHDAFGFERFQVDAAFLSLLTKRPQDANPLTRIPHYDEVLRPKYALLHFLSPRVQGGTGFYRQRRTGFERISVDRKDRFHEALRDDYAAYGEPPMAYMSGSNEGFDQIGYFEGQLNRLLIYSGALLHSAHVPDDFADPRTGRLTANLFVVIPPPQKS